MKISILQSSSKPCDYQANLNTLRKYATLAKEKNAELLITPEMFLSGYVLQEQLAEVAKALPLSDVQKIAKDLEIALIVGAPRVSTEGIFNTAYFIDSHGNILNHYDKTHLFGHVDREQFLRGNQLPVITEYKGFKIAMLICYDVEFPEAVRACAKQGAQLIAIPTAQMEPYSFINRSVIPTRAWENQVYIAYVNQIGTEKDFNYVGLSCIAAPHGEILQQASKTHEELLFSDLDLDAVVKQQQENPYLTDLRSDLY